MFSLLLFFCFFFVLPNAGGYLILAQVLVATGILNEYDFWHSFSIVIVSFLPDFLSSFELSGSTFSWCIGPGNGVGSRTEHVDRQLEATQG